MPMLILIAVGALVICLYLYLCLLVLIFLVVPLSIAAVATGSTAGVLIALVLALGVLSGKRPAGAVRTPNDVVAGRLPRRERPHQVRRDWAWPQYFAAQVVLDLAETAGWSGWLLKVAWRWPVRRLVPGDHRVWFVSWPLVGPVLGALVGISAGMAVGVLVTAALFAVVSLIAWILGLGTAGLLRTVDRTWQSIFRSGGTCPRCYEVTRLPAYRCPGRHPRGTPSDDTHLHRDIRPGRLGVLWRRCGCGSRLPTTVLRASRVMRPCCSRCDQPLPTGAAVDTDVRVPVFGAASAGKSHLIMAALVDLHRGSAGSGRVEVEPADPHSQQLLTEYAATVDSGGSVAKTNVAQQPVAVTLRIRSGRRRAMLHVFDAAGEALADPDQSARLAYLDFAGTFVFVLDPFSIPAVRDAYQSSHHDLFQRANAATTAPESAYNATVSRISGHGAVTARQWIAVVVSKQDLLVALPIGRDLSGDSAVVRDWLVGQQMDNFVTAVERDFGAVRYFLVSATGQGGSTASAPFRWLLSGTRIPLPRTGDPAMTPAVA